MGFEDAKQSKVMVSYMELFPLDRYWVIDGAHVDGYERAR